MQEYFRFHVRLLYVEPPIWRRFLLRKSATFQDLHEAIQEACAWGNCHLFSFQKEEHAPGCAIAGMPDDEVRDPDPDPDATKVKLASHFGKDSSKACYYLYDFGDSWLHEVKLLETVSSGEKFTRKLEGGERAFPSEDCGGVPGYENCVSVLKTGEDPEGIRDWVGDWRPEAFDLEEVRKRFDRGF